MLSSFDWPCLSVGGSRHRISFTYRYQELSKYTPTRYVSAGNVSPSTYMYTHTHTRIRAREYYVHTCTCTASATVPRFNVRCPIRCIYLPLQPGSEHGPFTPGGIHKSNKETERETEERKREGEGECLARRCSRVSLRAPPRCLVVLAFIIIPDDR